MAAVLTLTLTACGGGSSDKKDSGKENTPEAATADSADCVYNAEQVVIEDEEGMLGELNVEALSYMNGRMYATGFSYADADMGSHVLLNFAPDGSDLQYTTLMGGGMEDIISISIGSDGNYYMARVSYEGESFGTSSAGSTQEEHAQAAEPGAEAAAEAAGPEGAEEVVEAAGPEGAKEDIAANGPTAESAEEMEPDYEIVNMEEFFTDGGESPDEDPTLMEDEAAEGVTSPADEVVVDETDAEAELVVSDVQETDGTVPMDGEAVYMLSCISPDGMEVWTAPAKVPETPEAEYFVNAVALCGEGLLVSGSTGLDLYSKEDGSFIRTIGSAEELQGATPYVLEDGTVVVLTYGGSGEELNVVSLEDGSLSGHYAIPSEVGMTSVFPGKTYQVYLSGTNAVYGMNLDGSPVVKVIDFVDSDMDITVLTCLSEMEDGKLAAVVSDVMGTSIVEILTKVDPETLAGRKLLTLGCYYLDYEVRKQIFAFNKQSPDVRISIVDYSKYDGDAGTEGMTKLNTDIASGSAPDILILSGVMPVKSYISKGVFEDLKPYFDGDEEISGKPYLNNVLDAFKTGDNLYTLVPSFYVSTIVGKTADIGDGSGFTPDLADNLAKAKNVKPEKMFGTATREDILYQALELCGEQFIDWENSSCSFDSPEFIRLMQFISQFPAKIENTQEEDTSADYRSGKSLFYRESIGAFDEYVNLKYGVFGEEITLAGFPSLKPGTAVIFPQLQIAINSSSENKDACWSFVRRFLLDDYQNSLEMYWPVSIAALDQLANKAMEPLYYEDEFGNQVEDHIIVNIGGEDIKLPRISDSEVDQMYAFLKGLNSDAYFDSNVENIVAEETAAFFEGQKSAEDVAGVIQSRVQIYINENS